MPPEVPTGIDNGTEWAAEIEKLPGWSIRSEFGGYTFGRWPEKIVAFYSDGLESLFGLAVFDKGVVTVDWFSGSGDRWQAAFEHLVAPYRAEPRQST